MVYVKFCITDLLCSALPTSCVPPYLYKGAEQYRSEAQIIEMSAQKIIRIWETFITSENPLITKELVEIGFTGLVASLSWSNVASS